MDLNKIRKLAGIPAKEEPIQEPITLIESWSVVTSLKSGDAADGEFPGLPDEGDLIWLLVVNNSDGDEVTVEAFSSEASAEARADAFEKYIKENDYNANYEIVKVRVHK